MSSSTSVKSDNSWLSKIDRWVFKAESFFNLLGGIIIFVVVLLAVANIVGRKLLNTPVNGYIDWVEQSMAFFAFLGIAYCQREGGHIRMDIVVSKLKGRVLWLFECISTVFMLVVTLLLIYGSWLHFERAYTRGDSSIDINLSTWPAKLVVPIALSILALRLSLQLWAFSRAFIQNAKEPVAVPLVEDAATQAIREAESVSASLIDDNKGDENGSRS